MTPDQYERETEEWLKDLKKSEILRKMRPLLPHFPDIRRQSFNVKVRPYCPDGKIYFISEKDMYFKESTTDNEEEGCVPSTRR